MLLQKKAMMKVKMLKKTVNYSRRLINLIEDADPDVTDNTYDTGADQSPSQLINVIVGARTPIHAANIVMKYSGNDPQKAVEVINDLRRSINSSQYGLLDKLIEIVQKVDEPVSQ